VINIQGKTEGDKKNPKFTTNQSELMSFGLLLLLVVQKKIMIASFSPQLRVPKV